MRQDRQGFIKRMVSFAVAMEGVGKEIFNSPKDAYVRAITQKGYRNQSCSLRGHFKGGPVPKGNHVHASHVRSTKKAKRCKAYKQLCKG